MTFGLVCLYTYFRIGCYKQAVQFERSIETKWLSDMFATVLMRTEII